MAHDVFVSHSSKDKSTADAVCAVLESHGIRCWVAPRDILPGQDWGGSIIEAINGARAMVLIFSANANASPQIKREVERAVNKGVAIIPLRIEDVAPTATLEYFISTSHWLDAFTPPLDRHLQYLAEVVRKIVGGPEVSIPPLVRESESREKAEAEAARSTEEKKATELAELKLAEEKSTAEAAEAARSTEEKRKAEEQAKREEEKRKAAEEADYDQVPRIKKSSEGRKLTEASPHRLRQALRKILGSFLSACIGWLIVALVAAIVPSLQVQPHLGFWPRLYNFIFVLGIFVLPSWLLVLLPLYLLVPRTSKLWWIPICTAAGALSGALITAGCYFAISRSMATLSDHFTIDSIGPLDFSAPVFNVLGLTALAAVFGAVTCCFGAATANYFHHARAFKANRDGALDPPTRRFARNSPAA
jgi:TIR domain